MAVVAIDLAACINCGWCRRVCPTETIKYFATGHRTHVVDPDGCIDCGICMPVCPVDCIAMVPVTGDKTGWDAASPHPEWSGGFLWRWDHRLQRPSIRASSSARHPMLFASCDAIRKAQRRRPHLYDGFFAAPGNSTGRLHQYHGLGMTQHRHTAYAFCSSAPSGTTPVLRKRHSAMSNFRATATIPIRRKRAPPLPKRARNQTRRALAG